MKQDKKAKTLIGIVKSTAMKNVLVVEISRKKLNPIYKKSILISKKIKAFSDIKGVEVGDKVVIAESRPISKDVHYKIVGKE